MMNTFYKKYNRGDIIWLSTGEYSDYRVRHIIKILMDGFHMDMYEDLFREFAKTKYNDLMAQAARENNRRPYPEDTYNLKAYVSYLEALGVVEIIHMTDEISMDDIIDPWKISDEWESAYQQ